MRASGNPLSAQVSPECRLLLEQLRDVVMFIRVDDGGLVSLNRAAELLYGYTQAEFHDLTIFDLLPLSARGTGTPADATKNNLITREGVLFEAIHRHSSGGEIPVEVNARIADVGGEEVIIAVVRDITERRESERALQRAYAEVQQIFTIAAEGMRIIDRDFVITRANRTFTQMAGLEEAGAVGKHCFATFSGKNCHTRNCTIRRILAGADFISEELEKVRPDGTSTTCLLTARPYIVDGEIAGVLESFIDITERKQAEELAHELATHDALTGLPNRLLFTDRLDGVLARARREGTRPAMLFCDIDDFKAVNDTQGHAAGDEALRIVSAVLSDLIREVDTVARLGGDEFVVLLADTKTATAAPAVAKKILKALITPGMLGESELRVALSIGIAMYVEGDSVDSLMHRADVAMYEVKEAGGNSYRVSPG